MNGLARHLRLTAVAAVCALSAGVAHAYEYPLQFAPTGNFKDLVVAGYAIVGKTVVGNCSYTRITSGSGRDPRSTYTPIPQTCTWSLYGALLSVAPGAPAVPQPLAVQGTQTIYARKGIRIYTGTDAAYHEGGFVFTFGAHYDWLTSNAYQVLPLQPLKPPLQPYTFTATLVSNGDIPLDISTLRAKPRLAAVRVTITATTCTGAIAVGSTCDVGISYDDSRLTSTTGLAYDALTIHLGSNAGQVDDFVQGYTDEVRIPPD